MLAVAYKAFVTRLSEVEEIRHIDWYNRQETRNKDQHEMDTPAVFIEFRPMQFSGELANKFQKLKRTTLQINFHLVTRNIASTHRGSLDQGQALSHYELVEKIIFKLEEFSVKKSYVQSLETGEEDEPILNRISVEGITPDHLQSQIIRTVITCETQAYLYLKKKEIVKWGVKASKVNNFTLPPGKIGG